MALVLTGKDLTIEDLVQIERNGEKAELHFK